MAIVVEEEKSRLRLTRVLMWLVVLAILGVAVYYVFFSRPEIIDIVAPTNFQEIDPLGEINLNPEDVVQSPVFQSLKQHITPPRAGNAGRENPFLAP